jgi:hypothetical protein
MKTALGRRTVMRRVYEIAFPVLLMACAPVGSQSQTPEPTEAAPAVEAASAIAGVEIEEVARPPVDPGPQPKLEVVSHEFNEERSEMGLCPYTIQPHALPAISDDGTTLLAAKTVDVWPTDVYVELTWLDADGTRVEKIYNKRSDDETCDAATESVREEVAALNAKLASQTWRPLEPLDVLYSNPGIHAVRERLPGGGELAGLDEVLESLPIADRPIEVFYHGGHFIARVRDQKVLQKTPQPEWPKAWYTEGFTSESCEQEVLISAVAFDRKTSIAVVDYNFDMEGGCLCSDPGRFVRLELSSELIAEAERRSNEKFMAAMTAAAGDNL